MTVVDLVFIFFVLPVICAILIGYPLLLVVGMLIDRQETVELRPPWWMFRMSGGALNNKRLLRPANLGHDNNRLVRPVAASPYSAEYLLQSSSSDECPTYRALNKICNR